MVAIPSRRKSLALLGAVLLAQVLLLAVQIKRDSRGRLLRVWAVSGASPFERSAAWGFGRVRGVWNHYFALQNTSRENEALRVENDALKLTIGGTAELPASSPGSTDARSARDCRQCRHGEPHD